MLTKMSYDIDGVLGDFGGHLLNYLNIKDKSPILKFGDQRIIDNIERVYDDKKFWLTIPQLVYNLPIRPHCYNTNRPVPAEWTLEWLWKCKFQYAELYCIGNKHEYYASKVEAFKQSGATHHVDDAVHNYEQLTEAGIPCFLLTHHYNKSVETNMRIDSLSDLPLALINHRTKTI